MAAPSQDPGLAEPDADVQLIMLHRQHHGRKVEPASRGQLRRLLTRRQTALVNFVESRAKGNRGSVSVRPTLHTLTPLWRRSAPSSKPGLLECNHT